MAVEDDVAVFPMRGTDGAIIEAFVLRAMCHRGNSAHDLQGLARIVLALRRLPLATPGVVVVMTVTYRSGGEMTYVDLTINEDEFVLGEGSSTYDSEVGSDHSSNRLFGASSDYPEVIEQFQDWSYEATEWLQRAEELLSLGGNIRVEDLNEDDGIDWEEDAAEIYRERE